MSAEAGAIVKIEAHQLRLLSVMLPRWSKKRLRFVTRHNTLQVQETGLVLQGYQKRLSMPVLDYFFWSVLSEWTTVTIPYSCIHSIREKKYLLLRIALICLAWSPMILLL